MSEVSCDHSMTTMISNSYKEFTDERSKTVKDQSSKSAKGSWALGLAKFESSKKTAR